MKKRIQQLLIVLSMLLVAKVATAQITGTVTDGGTGEPIPGVEIMIKGTTTGVTTQLDGKYSIPAKQGDVLVFSTSGYAAQEVKAEGSDVSVSMSSDARALDEVMVVAYGTATKKSYTGSASTVKGKDIAKLQTSDVTKALEGAAAGVQIVSTSGQPGSGAEVHIRGIGSISAGRNPLYVVDGIPYEGNISSISASDIESMTVLKDAAANSLYGSRASNGVIMITTKKGKSGKARITFEARVGLNQKSTPNYDVMTDPAMFYEMTWEAMRNNQYYNLGNSWAEAGMYATNNIVSQLGGYNNYYAADNRIINPATGKLFSDNELAYHEDWNDAMFKIGKRQEYTATLSGGDEKTTYYLSLGYLNDEGYVVNSDFSRYTSRLKLDREVTKWLKVGTNLSYVKQASRTVSEQNTEGANMFYLSQIMAPIYPVHLYDNATKKVVFDSKGNARYDFGDDLGYARPVASMTNPVASQTLDRDNTDWNIFNGKFFSDIKVWDFKFSINYSVDASNNLGLQYLNGLYGQFKNADGISSRYGERNVTQTANQLLTWMRSFNKHNADVLLGHESYSNTYNFWYAQKEKFIDPDQYELAGAIRNPQADSYESSYALESYFARGQYNYDEKYYLTASVRRDGSSQFYKDNRWGNFWSLGASWRMKQESFLSDVAWLDDLKFKASYGTQGNDNLILGGVTPWADQFTIEPNGNDISLVFSYKGNKDITWEKSGTFNTGFDFDMFDHHLYGTVEYFYKKTTDLLFSRPLPSSSGISSYPDNIGDMVNHGVELELNGVIIKNNDLEWSVSFNATHFNNKITKLPPERKASGVTEGLFKLMEGKSRYEFFTKEYAGLSEDGRSQWYMDVVDASGNVTGVSTTTDYSKASDYFQGSALPTVYGGIGTLLRFKGIDFSIQTAYQLGGKGYDAVYASTMGGNSYGQNMHKDMLNRWTPTNTNTDVPRLDISEQNSNVASSRWFVSSDYFNIRNITLGYTLPKSMMKKVNIESLRVYAVVDNVWLVSARRGYDPRTAWNSVSAVGLYAPIRTMSLGLSLSF